MLGWELPPHNSGGLGTACYQLCKALSKQEIDIEFILPYRASHDINFMQVTPAHPQDASIVNASGIAYDSFRYVTDSGDMQWLDIHDQQVLYENAVARMAETKEFDIVHAHDWLTFKAAMRLKTMKNVPIILHVHSVESDRAGNNHGNPLVREIEESALLMADRIIAISNHTKQAMIRDYNIPEDKIEIVHNSIEASDIDPLDSDNTYKYLELMKTLGYRVVVNIGRLTIQKGLPNLLLAAAKVIERNPKTLFLIVGSGEQYEQLIVQSTDLGIGANVLFTEFQRGKAWRDAFAIGDLFVMPSVSEPFGLTPLESIGYGTPVLVSKQSGVSEVLLNALKVDYWDVDEMANQIATVVMNDALRDELTRSSYVEHQKMSWDKASERIHGIYKSHLGTLA